MTSLRGLRMLKRKFALPPEIEAAVQKEIQAAEVKPPPPAIPALEPRPLTASSQRVGCIAYKAGMTQDWDEHGVRVPLTVLWIDDCQVCIPQQPVASCTTYSACLKIQCDF
jgi:large subunit ribosomal protein L3